MGVGISRWRLAGSVAAGGGMGTLAAQGLGRTSALHRPDAEKKWIDPHGVETLGHEVRAALDHAGGKGLVAVNIMVAISHYHELVRSAVDAGAHAIVTGAGLPMDLPDTVGDAASNQGLSERRARAIAAWFRQRGFRGAVWYQGFGEGVLAVGTPDETDEPANRRAIYVLAADKPPVSDVLPRQAWKRL